MKAFAGSRSEEQCRNKSGFLFLFIAMNLSYQHTQILALVSVKSNALYMR